MEISVSVCLITYNHEKYIAQALESVLIQKTNFPVELIIGDDFSTDNTRKICLSYKEKYPNKVRLRLPDKNLGMMPNFIENLKTCNAKYVALLEGDDYWTDPHKLQKQVDFLEANPDYTVCFHNAQVIYEDPSNPPTLFLSPEKKDDFTIEVLCKFNYIPTASCVFRRDVLDNLPEWYYSFPIGDWPLHLMNAERGKIKYMPEIMSVYRNHSEGIWSGLKKIERIKKTISSAKMLNKNFNNKYKKYFYKGIIGFYIQLIRIYHKKNFFLNLLYSIKLLLVLKYDKFAISRREILYKIFR